MKSVVPVVDGTRLFQQSRLYDQSSVVVYGLDVPGRKPLVRVTTMKAISNPLVDIDQNELSPCKDSEYLKLIEKAKSENDTKHEKENRNLLRAKSRIFELAYCNNWEWFFTGTLDPKKYDRKNLEKWRIDFSQFLRDKSKKYGNKIDYELIPERHADGESWHMHGFLKGLGKENLKQFIVGDQMGKGIAKKVLNDELVYNWPEYQNKFGWCDLEPIKNAEAVSRYVTKYISKSLENSVREANAHLFYTSIGLNQSKTIKKGTVRSAITSVPVRTYESEYSITHWYDYDNIAEILSAIE